MSIYVNDINFAQDKTRKFDRITNDFIYVCQIGTCEIRTKINRGCSFNFLRNTYMIKTNPGCSFNFLRYTNMIHK